MTDHDELRACLQRFADTCSGNQRLQVMNRDWHRVIRILATDGDGELVLVTQGGQVRLVDGPDPPELPEISVRGDVDTLLAVFSGDLPPTEPYMDGRLVVLGSQDDVVRLDFVTLLIWG